MSLILADGILGSQGKCFECRDYEPGFLLGGDATETSSTIITKRNSLMAYIVYLAAFTIVFVP